MTEEQKEILIAKMLDAPSSLSGGELDMISHDEELRDIYEASAAVSGACIRHPAFDMDAEWERFRPRLRRRPAVMRQVMRVAAVLIGVVFASNIVVGIIDDMLTIDQSPQIARSGQPRELDMAPVLTQNPQVNGAQTDGAENVAAISVSRSAGTNHHLAKVNPDRSETVPPRNDAVTDIDIDEYLRIQQARVDNELAMQVAESYIEEYDDMVTLLDAVGAYNPDLDNLIRKVTME